ncbi:MAG: IS1595 family transposase [Planctomycetaceae bacterium]|nr:IS1595 family transposase [Planctomycetaceae bacterium]
MDVLDHAELPFPTSLTEFQTLFPNDKACAEYLEKVRWENGFECPHCGATGEPFRIATRPNVLRCRKCRKDVRLTVGTVMERSCVPLSIWFCGAYLITSQTPGMSATQFQRQLGLSRYETAYGLLHKLRSAMVRPDQDKIGGREGEHVEVDETLVGGRTRGEGRGKHHKVIVSCAVEVKHSQPGTAQDKRKDGRYAGRLRLSVQPDRTASSLCGFVESTVAKGTLIVTDNWKGYSALKDMGLGHHAIAECGDPEIADEFLPISHAVFSNLKAWLMETHHGVSPQHLQAYLNEFTFRFNRRYYPMNAFRSLLGLATHAEAPTYADLYSGKWKHPTCCG